MTKRTIAWTLSVIMLLSVLANVSFHAVAAETQHNHSNAHSCSEQCADGTITWTAWGSNSFPTTSGHYYLTKDITLPARITVAAGKDITICLNGYDMTVASGATGSTYIQGKLIISDCTAYYDGETYVSGAVSGSKSDNGGLMNVRAGGAFVLEGGKLTGNTATASGGAISIQGSTAAVVHVYGGEITGNYAKKDDGTLRSGAGIVVNNGGNLYLHGGKIYDNTGNTNGDIYVVGKDSNVVVSGDPMVGLIKFGDANNQNLQVNGLTAGADLTVTTGSAEHTIDQVISVAQGGSQTDWDSSWVKINGQVVSMDKGSFVFGIVKPPVVHDHCQDGLTDCGHTQESWQAWTATDSLPTTEGNYFLAEDVTVAKVQTVTGNVKLCLNGHSITRSGSRIINVDAGGNLTITDCQNSGTIVGGGISLNRGNATKAGGVLNLYSGIVDGNTATNGVIYMQTAQDGKPGPVFNMYGGEIKNSTVTATGGIVLVQGENKGDTPTTFNMYGGSITGCKASEKGAAVYANGGAVLNLLGSTITGNQGGVSVTGKVKATLAGNVRITENTGFNLYLQDGVRIRVGEMTEGAKVSVQAAPGAFTESCQDMHAYFTSDSGYRRVDYVDGALHMVADGSHKHCLCTGVTTGCDHTNIAWMAWEATDSLPTSGTYYLLNDVMLKAEVSISKDLTLCLNGHTVTAAKDVRIFSTVKDSGATVTITDCGSTGKLTGGVDIANNTGGGAIFIRSSGTLNLFGGTISDNKSVTAGGAILLAKDTNFNMYGGTITRNGALDEGQPINGAAVFAMPQAKVTIAGGIITGNTGKYGGAIYANGGAEVYVTGGTITGNTAARGGGIYTNDNTVLNITGGTISGNIAATEGGGVYGYGSIVTVSGGTVTGNRAGTSGGGLRFGADSQVVLKGGTVSENYAETYGGGVYANGGTLDITDKVLITKNEAGTAGGGVCFNNSIVGKISGGTISNNFAPNAGGVIIQSASDLEVKANVEMSGGMVTGNIGNGSGGGIYVINSAFKLSGGAVSGNRVNKSQGGGILAYKATTEYAGGKITGNTAPKDGGGLYISGGTAKLSGMTITGNTSKASGGGFGATKQAVITMTGGLVSGNAAPNACGVIIQGGSTLNMYGGTVSNNKAEKSGGGMYINNKSTLNMYGGTFTGNEAAHGGALYVNKSTANLQGGLMKGNKTSKYAAGVYLNTSTVTMGKDLVIEDNAAQSYSGGMYAKDCELTINGTTFRNNYSRSSGGGFYVYNTKLTVTDMLVSGNVCDNACGGIGISQESVIDIRGGIVENNTGTQGGGIMIQNRSTGAVKNLTVRGNEATMRGGGIMCYGRSAGLTFENCDVYENKTATYGGGIFLISTNGHTPWLNITLNDMKVHNNTAAEMGAGLCAYHQSKVTVNGGEYDNNTAGTEGGGIYTKAGSDVTINNVKVTGNKAALTGSGLYVGDNILINGLIATGNTAGEGAAVYFPQNMYDGESFTLGYYVIGGDILVTDNAGGDMFIDEGTAITTTAEGLGKNTRFHVQLATGILTNTILGAYDYEGGNLDYMVTYGTRSVTEPEYEAPIPGTETEQTRQEAPAEKNTDTWLYVTIGAVALVVIAAVILVITKKKKPEAANQ